MSQSFETEFEIDKDVPLVRIIREFAAEPARVFAAHADGAQYAKWIGPPNSSVTIDHWDCRIGGSYRWAVVRDDFEARFFGSFHDVRVNELIVQTFTFEGMRGEVALEKLRFEPIGKGQAPANKAITQQDKTAPQAPEGGIRGYRASPPCYSLRIQMLRNATGLPWP